MLNAELLLNQIHDLKVHIMLLKQHQSQQEVTSSNISNVPLDDKQMQVS